MGRPHSPPGAPPPHWRPPGTPLPPPGAVWPLASPEAGSSPRAERPVGLLLAVALVALLVGMSAGYLAGLAGHSSDDTAAPPLTSPDTTTRPPGDTVPQAPPVAPGSELPPTDIGSLDVPVPPGQSYVLGLYEIGVVDATVAPTSGGESLRVTLSVRSTDSTRLWSPGVLAITATDGSTWWGASDLACGDGSPLLSGVGVLAPGEGTEGLVCFQLPAGTRNGVVLAIDGFDGAVHFALPV